MCVSFSLLIYISFDPSLTEIVPTFPHSTLYTVTFHHCDISPLYTQCTLHTIHCDFSSLCTLHCTLFPTVQCTLYTLHFPQCALYTVHHPKEKEIEFATFRRQPLRAKYLFTKTNWMHSTFYFFLLVFWFIELLITLSIGQLKMHDQMVNAEETNSTYYFRCLGWRYQPHTTCDKSHDLQTYWGAQQSLQQKCHRFKFFIDTGQQCFMSLQHS